MEQNADVSERNGQQLRWVQVTELLRDPPFPARESESPLDSLLSSVRIHGVLSPLLARPRSGHLQVVCGYRRLLAAKAAGQAEVPVLIAKLEDIQAIRCYLSENICRRELSPRIREETLKLLQRLRDGSVGPRDTASEGVDSRHEEGEKEVPESPAPGESPTPEPRSRTESLHRLGAQRGSSGRSRMPRLPSPRTGVARDVVPRELMTGTRSFLESVRRTRRVDLVRAESIVALLLGIPRDLLPLDPNALYTEERESWLAEHALLCASLNACLAPPGAVPETRRDYALAGLLHDIGMVFLDRAYLSEPRALSPGQMAEVQSHTRLGQALILGADPARAELARAARDHHERQDGSGYPDGLRGEQLTELSRATAVGDTYASLVGNRPHRNALPPEVALERLVRATEMGLYDPKLVARLRHVLLPVFSSAPPLSRRSSLETVPIGGERK